MPPAGFEPTISAGERPQTYASDRAAIGTGNIGFSAHVYCTVFVYDSFIWPNMDISQMLKWLGIDLISI